VFTLGDEKTNIDLAWCVVPLFLGEIIATIYGPMNYTAPYEMVLMGADPIRGKVGGGWVLEIETFWTL
jgi:hypothetical protein